MNVVKVVKLVLVCTVLITAIEYVRGSDYNPCETQITYSNSRLDLDGYAEGIPQARKNVISRLNALISKCR